MLALQLSKHRERADLAALVERVEQLGLHPKNVHDRSPALESRRIAGTSSSPSRNRRCHSSKLRRAHRRAPGSGRPRTRAPTPRAPPPESQKPPSPPPSPPTHSVRRARPRPPHPQAHPNGKAHLRP